MRIWNSTNLEIPLHEFIRMFRLTKKELIREGASGRLIAIGIRVSNVAFEKVAVSERSARDWMTAPGLPPRVQRKIREAGGLDCLEQWRKRYFEQCQFDFDNNTVTLPDGEVIADVRVSERLRPN